MSETITAPIHFRVLYCDVNGWRMFTLHKSACGSFYYCSGNDILLREIGDLLDEYGIVTVEYDYKYIILNRGNAVEKLKDLVASQEKVFDDYCLQNNAARNHHRIISIK